MQANKKKIQSQKYDGYFLAIQPQRAKKKHNDQYSRIQTRSGWSKINKTEMVIVNQALSILSIRRTINLASVIHIKILRVTSIQIHKINSEIIIINQRKIPQRGISRLQWYDQLNQTKKRKIGNASLQISLNRWYSGKK